MSLAAQAGDEQGCKLIRAANLDMTFDQAGRPLVPVTINGVAKQALVDTGGVFSSVTDAGAKELKLRTEPYPPQRIFFLDGSYVTQISYPDSFAIGHLTIPTPRFALMVAPPSYDNIERSATLAPDIMHVFDVEFDFAAGKFELFAPSDCGEKVVHWTHEPYAVLPFEMNENGRYGPFMNQGGGWQIVARATLDGTEVDATIDTGSYVSNMTLGDANEVIPSGEDKNLKHIDNGAGAGETYSYPFKSLKLDAIAIDNPTIIIRPNKLGVLARAGKIRPQLLLGASVLRRLHLYISYKEKKIYLTDAVAH